ncbi:hypothetical protein CRG98_032074 [Punica granatum]|uniref:Retrotransposon Copia-like N-terminal domain-containing protein n=1 Tax=Punica granatum TaxID=22663 RepID=A0A2I0IU22_PUNGR|nr:hypothetical protein CRG98_032074 [Punica granatum]
MTIALTVKGKLGFIEGRVLKRPAGDSNLEKWEMCNSLVLASILNGLEKNLQPSVAYATDVKPLWDNLKERCSQRKEMRIYQLKSDICMYRQGRGEDRVSRRTVGQGELRGGILPMAGGIFGIGLSGFGCRLGRYLA